MAGGFLIRKGYKMAQQPNVVKDFFVYAPPLPFSNIAVGGNSTQQISIQADSDFLLEKMSFLTNQANAVQTYNTQTWPNLSVLITDTGSGRQLMNVAIPIVNLFGSGEKPFKLEEPKLFKANSIIQVQVFNFDAAVANYNTYLSFIGRKVFTL